MSNKKEKKEKIHFVDAWMEFFNYYREKGLPNENYIRIKPETTELEKLEYEIKKAVNSKRVEHGYTGIILLHPKKPANLGLILRLAYNFNVAFVEVVGLRFPIWRLTDIPTNTHDFHRAVPTIFTDELVILEGAIPVLVEVHNNATPLDEFKHPLNAVYIFGPEDGTAYIENAQKVYIPTNGCLNLAMAATIVLWDRFIKSKMQEA